MTKEQQKEYQKAWYQANKEQQKEYQKAYKQAHKEQLKEYQKAYYKANKEQVKEYNKAYNQAHKEQQKEYKKSDVNSLGQTKHSIRNKSLRILKKSGIKIPGYQIHHCFTYDDASKFIYCSKEMHLKIHQFLRDNNIDADTDHYEQIKHLLDKNVVTFGL